MRGFGWRLSSQSLQIVYLALCFVRRLARNLSVKTSTLNLEDSLSLAIAENKDILLVGDPNANFVPTQRTYGVSREIKDTLIGFGMSQLINEPTGIAKSSTLIDVIRSAHPPNISVTKVI